MYEYLFVFKTSTRHCQFSSGRKNLLMAKCVKGESWLDENRMEQLGDTRPRPKLRYMTRYSNCVYFVRTRRAFFEEAYQEIKVYFGPVRFWQLRGLSGKLDSNVLPQSDRSYSSLAWAPTAHKVTGNRHRSPLYVSCALVLWAFLRPDHSIL
ncbi:uncharacterized protein BT62DRAFT_757469 [Guyanagaster necrorhizus]|uniref:Uncharacterized protein n=1 Tax=Guyanagaster necrorhizus TaxID=856835 RepID=A0A9P7VWU7_9AGAR|nr:uncharacterized protein BT62DRAFT_757469 [Guyanagaster necrorhizus MCA 3950]KAG7448180.1 hypothetical protein BT62DRAFT_757469 [Guyanagaster necrorhizus MCA 3950]